MRPSGTAQVLASELALGEAEEFRRIARGAMGAVWKLTTSSGSYAAKEPFWFRWEERAVREELAFRSACAAAGVRSPEPVLTSSGGPLVDHDGTTWRVCRWLDGEVPGPADLAATRWLADQMGRIHELGRQAGEAVPTAFYHRVEVDWDGLAERSAGAVWADGFRRRVPLLCELTALVNEAPIGEPVWCHRDLKNSNVVRSPAGSVLVDWDNAGPLAPWRELGALLIGQLDAEDNLRRILEAYRGAGGPAEIAGLDGFATGLAILLNHLDVQVRGALDPDLGRRHRDHAARAVVEVLPQIPDVRRIERAVQVVRR